MKLTFLISAFSALLLLVACVGSDEASPDNNQNKNPAATTLNINTSETFQTIDGFGAADGIFNTGSYLSKAEEELAFGTGDGQLGMSIFRVKLPYNPNNWNLIAEHATAALAYEDMKILASPWSPPPALKSNQNGTGGFLLKENYAAYADHINDFLSFMENEAVEIYAISPQNEPDIQVSYESCDWTSTAMRDFIIGFGGDHINSRIAAPESFNFNQTFIRPLLLDDNAVNNFDIVAGHIYGGGLARFELAEEKGKRIWMTEHLYNLNTGNTGATPWIELSDEVKWNETMRMLSDIHQAMTYNWNAYIWWYTKRYYSFLGDGTQGTSHNTVLKRGYAYAHFSRFIRPGYVRVAAEFTSLRDLKLTAYQNDNRMVIVVVNDNATPVPNITLTVDGETPGTAQLYTTSLQLNMDFTEIQAENDLLRFSMIASSVATIIID